MESQSLDQSLAGAYGKDRQDYLKNQSYIRQSQRIHQIHEETAHIHSWKHDQSERKQHQEIDRKSPIPPRPDHHLGKKPGKRQEGKKLQLMRLIEIKSGYYEAELLKELKIKKETVEADVEEADRVPIYKEYQHVKGLRVSSDKATVPLNRRTLRGRNVLRGENFNTYSVRHESEKASVQPSEQSVSHSTPVKSSSVKIGPGKRSLNRSLAIEDKVLQQELGNETRRQRILEKSIFELDQKLARFKATHEHSASLGQVSKVLHFQPERLLRKRY